MISKLSDGTLRSTAYAFVIVGAMGILGGCAAQQQEPVTESPEADQPAQAEQQSVEEEDMEQTEATAQAETSETEEARAPAQPAMSDEVRNYIRMASEDYTMPEGDEKYDHVYTASRFRSLASALESSASAWNLGTAEQQQVSNSANTLREAANEIQEKRIAPHSKQILKGLEAGGDAMDYFNGKKAGLGSIHAEMMDQVDSFDSGVVFLDQASTVEAYFKSSARFFRTLYQ